MQLSWPPAGPGTALSLQEIVISQHLLLLSLQARTYKHLLMYAKRHALLHAECPSHHCRDVMLESYTAYCSQMALLQQMAWLLLAQTLYAAASAKLRCYLCWTTNLRHVHCSYQPVSLAQVAILGTFSHIAMSSLGWHTESTPALSNKLWMQLAQLESV